MSSYDEAVQAGGAVLGDRYAVRELPAHEETLVALALDAMLASGAVVLRDQLKQVAWRTRGVGALVGMEHGGEGRPLDPVYCLKERD